MLSQGGLLCGRSLLRRPSVRCTNATQVLGQISNSHTTTTAATMSSHVAAARLSAATRIPAATAAASSYAASAKVSATTLANYPAAVSSTPAAVALLEQRRSTHTTGGPVPSSTTPGVARNQPLGAAEAPWPAGIASFMRLPLQRDAKGLDACFVGVPLDIGCTNRNGCRFGPRQIRNESVGVRPYNSATDAAPFQDLQVADIGDVAFTMYNLPDALQQIRTEMDSIVSEGCVPLVMGGDHTITYPILQAIAKRHGPVAVVHVDAHADTSDSVWGSKTMHATPFRRAVEEELVQPQYFYQIGLRATTYEKGAYDWSREQGFHVVPATECWHKSLSPLMAQVRDVMGDRPVFLTFDIDAIDPSFCPGTGTREIAGLTVIQALEIIRGMKGLNLVGCDLVEVSPPYDNNGITAGTAANLLYEMLCALPAVR